MTYAKCLSDFMLAYFFTFMSEVNLLQSSTSARLVWSNEYSFLRNLKYYQCRFLTALLWMQTC